MLDLSNKGKLPLKDMTEEQVGHIVKFMWQGKFVEVWSPFNEKWFKKIGNTFIKEDVYRMLPPKDSFDFTLVDKSWKYLARDRSDNAYLFQTKPTLGGISWVGGSNYSIVSTVFNCYENNGRDWKDSLVANPYS